MEPSFFTINACNRCRKRKARCDTGIPTCIPCRNAGATCEYTDPRTKDAYPREFIHVLEDQLASLEKEFAASQIQAGEGSGDNEQHQQPPPQLPSSVNVEDQAHPDLIRLEAGGDAHFLGVSSGMHMARSVLESAQRNNANFESRSHGDNRFQSDTALSPTQATDSRVPRRPSHTVLPSRETAMNLIDVFFSQYQIQYPILIEDDFTTIVSSYYTNAATASSREDPWIKFMMNMTFASSLVFLSQENRDALGLAQGFSSNAMAEFSTIMQIKGIRTLQCLLLLLLYSVLSSSSAPIWYISGLCMRMCVDLGLHSERTISVSGKGEASQDEIDTKRRLFWVTYTFDRTLSIMLGRPFTLDDATIDVKFPDSSLPVAKRPQILHWLKLQQLQSEIVSRLYIIRDDKNHPPSELSTWISGMTQQLAVWNDESLALTEPTGPNIDWWRYWYQNALLILHRPSPTNHRPHSQNLTICYEAAKSLIQLCFIRVNRGLTDFTWLELHYQVMSGITLLFLVWDSPEARATAKSEWITFKSCLAQWEFVLARLTDRWDRMARSKEVLMRLADATVDIIEKGMMKASGETSKGQRQRREEDENRRRSIMAQLGSPEESSAAQATAQPSSHGHMVVDQRSRTVEEGILEGHNVYKSSPNSHATASMQDLPMEPFTAPDMTNQHMQQAPWPTMQQFPQHSGFENMDTSLTADVSAMLADEGWPSLGPYDNAGVLGSFGLFEYFPMSLTGNEDFEFPGAGMAARADGMVTDSVLNFRESWDDGTGADNGNL